LAEKCTVYEDDPYFTEIDVIVDVIDGKEREILSSYADALKTYELVSGC
jgi:hypothetical protein